MKVFGIVGRKNSGKTHLVTRLVRLAARRGLRVSTLKHAHHSFDIDRPGKDSHLHREAGAHEVLVASAERWALMHEHRGAPEPSLVELLSRLAPCDLVLVEGFKREVSLRLEVYAPVAGSHRSFSRTRASWPWRLTTSRLLQDAATCRACRWMTTRRCWTTCSRGPESLPQWRRPAHRAHGS
jgi:molybdopterin-guanine dinucleotide biosynthesis protein B